jgi:glycosyltransferase involved in cell wall biosynthesis
MPDFCEAVNLVISPSEGMKKILREFKVESPIEVVPNGADLQPFQQAKPLSRADFGFSNDDILLVYAGRIAPEKNLGFLLQAFAGIAQTLHHVHLLVVGGGQKEHEDELRSIANELHMEDRVKFTGMVSKEKLPGYLAMCDIFVTTSVTEVHPFSVIEAMATGLPVVGIHSPGVSDSISDGVSGLLATNDMAAYTAKLIYLCLHTELQKKYGAEALKDSEQYSIERTTKIMLGHYSRLLQNTKPVKPKFDERLMTILEEFLK